MTHPGGYSVFDPFGFLSGAGLAPQSLSQDILHGWSLVSITTNNSSAPDTERRIVEKVSYGRQIGRLMDAVEALIADLPEEKRSAVVFRDLTEMKKEIDELKIGAASNRLDRLPEDLALIKRTDAEAYKRRIAELRALLG
ncbi:MAG TPA: hypothetical protein VNH64_08905 [Parvularculaceae bacterium]|nr:hypothetical protein [Parvularculaceae bacterium]